MQKSIDGIHTHKQIHTKLYTARTHTHKHTESRMRIPLIAAYTRPMQKRLFYKVVAVVGGSAVSYFLWHIDLSRGDGATAQPLYLALSERHGTPTRPQQLQSLSLGSQQYYGCCCCRLYIFYFDFSRTVENNPTGFRRATPQFLQMCKVNVIVITVYISIVFKLR